MLSPLCGGILLSHPCFIHPSSVRLQDLLHEVTKLLYEVTPRADRSNGAQRARAGPGARPRVRPGSRARWSASGGDHGAARRSAGQAEVTPLTDADG